MCPGPKSLPEPTVMRRAAFTPRLQGGERGNWASSHGARGPQKGHVLAVPENVVALGTFPRSLGKGTCASSPSPACSVAARERFLPAPRSSRPSAGSSSASDPAPVSSEEAPDAEETDGEAALSFRSNLEARSCQVPGTARGDVCSALARRGRGGAAGGLRRPGSVGSIFAGNGAALRS